MNLITFVAVSMPPSNTVLTYFRRAITDTDSWEQKMAQVLEEMDEVVCYVKNHGLGFTIPYALNGDQKNYIPDFVVQINDGQEEALLKA